MSAQKWHRVEDVRAFLAQKGRRSVGTHQLTKRILHWPYCARCGLVALKNQATAKELSKPCVVEE